jgi:hypothetical protein
MSRFGGSQNKKAPVPNWEPEFLSLCLQRLLFFLRSAVEVHGV